MKNKGKNIRIAEALQHEIDSSLKSELKTYDDISENFGDAFLIQLADSITHQMKRRASLVQLAGAMDGVLEYYKKIYPQEFVNGLVKDYKSGK